MKFFSWDSVKLNNKNERRFVLFLCILAMLRVFLFSAAFPFFTNIDETYHLDTIIKYAKGDVPLLAPSSVGKDKLICFDYRTARLIALYGTLEYFEKPDGNVEYSYPLWRFIDTAHINYINILSKSYFSFINLEIYSPPVYYTIAGIWFNIGQTIGIKDGFLLYWLRFFNVIVYGLLVWLAYLFCNKVLSTSYEIRIGLPILLVAFPQDVFYSLNPDILSPLFCLLSIYLLFQIYQSDKNLLYYFFTGIIISSTILIKFINIPILIIFFGFLILQIKKYHQSDQLINYIWRIRVIFITAVVPVVLWVGWNLFILGDFTGSAQKALRLGWEKKQFVNWFSHPLFTISGFWIFITDLIKSFWRGELIWWEKRIAFYPADWFYVFSSIFFISVSIIGIILKWKNNFNKSLVPKLLFTMLLVMFILIIAVLSIQYDFGNCWYPSKSYPFFTSGRLISGVIVPFLILYVDGFIYLFSKLKIKVNPLTVLSFLSFFIIISEILISTNVFISHHNFYHLF